MGPSCPRRVVTRPGKVSDWAVLLICQNETTPAVPPETIICPLHTHSQHVTCTKRCERLCTLDLFTVKGVAKVRLHNYTEIWVYLYGIKFWILPTIQNVNVQKLFYNEYLN